MMGGTPGMDLLSQQHLDEVVAHARRSTRGMDIMCIYWIWMFIQDYGKGATITTGGGRSSDKTCSTASQVDTWSRDLAGKPAAGNH
jgi:hypothetical protein